MAAGTSPVTGTVVAIAVQDGDQVAAGRTLCTVESMKMHHDVVAACAGVVSTVAVSVGAAVAVGDVLVVVDEIDLDAAMEAGSRRGSRRRRDATRPLEPISPRSSNATVSDSTRRVPTPWCAAADSGGAPPERTSTTSSMPARSSSTGHLSSPLSAVAVDSTISSPTRRPTGWSAASGRSTASCSGVQAARCVVASYDYTVLAGTQGTLNHRKKDRLFELAAELRLPVVLFTEGGGGRPGDSEAPGPTGLDCLAFLRIAELSGLVPLVAVNAGYCFAGNAALLGCCDVVIATEDSNIGMGGPAMIEGGGLGVHEPTSIGPIDVQRTNGVVDIVVRDEAEGVAVAKRYLSYFQGPVDEWSCAEQTGLRAVVPEDRLRVYDVRRAVELMFDIDSVLELRHDFGLGVITALARLEGRAVGVLANNPRHLGGAIDSPAADKAARFMQLCDAFDLPLVMLVDTPGMMVGPEVEATALVRHCNRLFVTGANLTIPTVAVVLRKAYGLGAQAMMGGSTKAPLACFAWPTSEFGGMGLEGAVRLGYRRELEAAADDAARQRVFDELVARAYEIGKGISVASYFEIDDVIDPADTRRYIAAVLDAAPPPPRRETKKRPNIDTW